MSLVKSLAQMTRPSEDKNVAQFAIYDVVPAGSQPLRVDQKGLALQYFPESINLDRDAAYTEKNPIGSSHPLYQWIHGTARTLSIEAVFTAEEDVWQSNGTSNPISDAESVAQNVSNYIKNPIAAGLNSARGGVPRNNPNQTDVPSACLWLQSKTYPTYSAKSGNVSPPPKLALHIPNSGIQTFANNAILDDVFYCIMTRCSIKYTSFFKSGAPRIAEISLSFNEIIQIGNRWKYVSRNTFVYDDRTETAQSLVGPSIGLPGGGNGGGYTKEIVYKGPAPSITISDSGVSNSSNSYSPNNGQIPA